jgi:thioredoxin reductase (NADPH)
LNSPSGKTKSALVSNKTYDALIIGAGPAGLTAAAELAGAGLATLILDRLGPGGALINLGALEGVPDNVPGPHLTALLTDDATAAGAELGFGEVSKVTPGEVWTIQTADGEHHQARAVVVATGIAKGHLGLADEEAWEGRGLSHCAACDGPLFTGQPVVVAGNDGWAAHEVRELAGLADRVTVVGASAPVDGANVSAMGGRIVALEGSDGLEAVVVEDGGSRKSVPANAVFVYVGRKPAAEFVADLLACDAAGHIVVDKDGTASRPLAFAAGDVASGAPHSVAEAQASGERVARAIIARLKS